MINIYIYIHTYIYWLLLTLVFVLKVDLLKTKFGFDEAFNYKEEADVNAALKGSASALHGSWKK